MIKLNNILSEVIKEGGAGGHMQHPFDFTSTGKQLVDVFVKSIKSLKQDLEVLRLMVLMQVFV